MKYVEIKEIIFFGKQNIDWSNVENYLRRFDGMVIENLEYGDNIRINAGFADEYVHSLYTKKLRGALAKTKANLVQIIPELIRGAINRRWNENKADKHNDDAKGGWYRYDVCFSMPVINMEREEKNINVYTATAVARINDIGIFLYDIINIKKEARKPTDP